jgi:2-C-methyl-D-erythritol 2,4-cyclodiphosphate synthase
MADGTRQRIGIGIDAHRFVGSRPLVLGGVMIDYPLGLEGHSDADVLTHAIADALLGAAGLEDIGHYFPEADPANEGISSLEILKKVMHLLEAEGCRIGNVDAVLMLEEPKISPYREQMRLSLAEVMGISPADVSVRGTTTEKMGYTGRGEGIAAHAVALLECEIVMDLDL